MELLLINHPLDCPVCDKGGECPLQNQAMSNGRGETRFEDVKRTFPKPINISSQVLLDRERCVLCARCTRFSYQVAGDPFIEMLERGALQQVGIYEGQPFQSYFSGNTVQICPVGALTGAAYRFRSRPFDLVSSPGVCEHCASGCAIRTDHRRGKVLRRLAGDDPEVNEEWNCDKGRWAFQYATAQDRLTTRWSATRRRAGADVVGRGAATSPPTGWPRPRGATGVLVGGRSTVEDAYAYAKFARVALGTNDVDFRARPHSAEEASFLAAHVAGTRSRRHLRRPRAGVGRAARRARARGGVADPVPAAAQGRAQAGLDGVRGRAVREPRAWRSCPGRLLPTAPGTEADGARRPAPRRPGRRRCCACTARLVILVGERLAAVPGALSAVVRLAEATGARLAWVPRRAGERGALEAGALPGLLPGGRPVADAAARVDVATAWGVDALAETRRPRHQRHPRRGAHRRGPRAARRRRRPARPARPDRGARRARRGPVRRQPRAARLGGDRARRRGAARRAGRREGRHLPRLGGPRPAVRRGAARHQRRCPTSGCCTSSPRRWASTSACPTSRPRARELDELGLWDGDRAAFSAELVARAACSPAAGEAVLATWSQLLDAGRLQDGEPYLAGTARPAVARLSAGDRRGARRRRRRPGHRRHRPRRGHAARRWSPRCPTASSGCRPTRPVSPVRQALAAGPGSIVRLTAGATDVAAGRCRMSHAAVVLASPEVPGLRRRPVVAGRRQGRRRLRLPRRDDAVHDLVRSAASSPGCSTASGPTGSARRACCRASPTASSWR